MRNSWGKMLFVGVLILGMTGMASAEQFTLNSYNVVLNQTDPGLALYWNPILAQPSTWNLNVGQSVSFDLFEIGTKETWVNPYEDTAKKLITVDFTWTLPSGVIPDNVNGKTYGWQAYIIDGGIVKWDDTPAIFNFGNGGQFTLALQNADFCVPGHNDIDAKLTYTSASVPEPASLLFLGLGLVALAGVKRKFKN